MSIMENQETPKTQKKRKINLINILIIIAVIAGIAWIAGKFIHIGVEYTDNAQVRQNITPLNARIQGFIKEIRFSDFQEVKRGDTLVIIEDNEYRLRVLQTEASLQSARQGLATATTAASTARNNVEVSEASIKEVKVHLDNAATELARYGKLLEKKAVTQQQYDAVRTQHDATLAKYTTMRQQSKSTALVSEELQQRIEQQETLVEMAETALELARLNLSYTIITAPADGTMGRKTIEEGQLIQPGQPVGSLVEDGEIWIIANYKETQLENIRQGANVNIVADAVPGTTYKGVVSDISPATGASFSLIPTDNSAGNFVKVEQRIPIRIEFTGENSAEAMQLLRCGMNVECEIDY